METRIDILIDGSGSMGRETINGEQFLLPDGSSRTDLVKKILRDNLNLIIQDVDQLVIQVFRTRIVIDRKGQPVIRNRKYVVDTKDLSEVIYRVGEFNAEKFESTLNKLKDPPVQGTPLFNIIKKTVGRNFSTHQIIILTDGDGNDVENFDQQTIEMMGKLNSISNIHFIGIDQTPVAQKKCKRISDATNGSYVNIEAIDYDVNELNKLLFPIKAKFTQNQLEKVTEQELKKTKATSTVEAEIKPSLKKEVDNSKPDSNIDRTEKDELSHQVAKNSKALSQISIQLENIVALLNGNIAEESITIEENPAHNQRVGRKAEEILFKKLNTFKWEKVEWLNEKEESFNSYDFLTENNNHKVYYECKGTADNLNRFHLTDKEWSFYLANRGHYRLCFIQHVDGEPVIYRFMDLLDDLELGRLKLHHSVNHNVKANSITFFVDVEESKTMKI